MDVRLQNGHGLKYKDWRHILVYVGKRNTVKSAYQWTYYNEGSGEVALAHAMATSRRRARRLIVLCISNPNTNPNPSLVRDM